MSERSRRKVASSANAPRPRPDPVPQAAPQPVEPQPAEWELWLRRVRTWLPLVGIVVSIAVGAVFGLGTALLVLGAAVLLSAVSAIWASLQLVAGDASESAHDVVMLAAPGAELEQKQAVLRALKDLEFERTMGKIGEEDYLELRDRYRARARAVLQSLDRDVDPERAAAEKLVADYLKKQGLVPAHTPPRASRPAEDAAKSKPDPGKAAADSPVQAQTAEEARSRDQADQAPEPKAAHDDTTRLCDACSTRNDVDAAFCKKCGQRMQEVNRSEAGAEP